MGWVSGRWVVGWAVSRVGQVPGVGDGSECIVVLSDGTDVPSPGVGGWLTGWPGMWYSRFTPQRSKGKAHPSNRRGLCLISGMLVVGGWAGCTVAGLRVDVSPAYFMPSPTRLSNLKLLAVLRLSY